MARPWLVPVLLLLVPAAAAHGADPTVWVPESVVGGSVPFLVQDLEPGETSATLTIGSASAVVDVTGKSSGSGALADVSPGLRSWTLAVTDGTDTHTVEGHVFVQDPLASLAASLDALSAKLDTVTADVDAMRDLVGAAGDDDGNAPDLRGNLTRLESNVTALAASLGQVRSLLLTSAAESDPAPTASLADPVGRAGTFTTGLLVLGLAAFVAVSQVRAQKRRREAMVLLLSVAAKLQVSPESVEFRSAVEALDR